MNLRSDQQDERLRLIEYLDQHAFQPVRRAFPDRYRERMWNQVSEAQTAVTELRTRYLNAPSAGDVIQMFNTDLDSDWYKELSERLKAVNLPTFYDVQDGFMRLAGLLEIA